MGLHHQFLAVENNFENNFETVENVISFIQICVYKFGAIIQSSYWEGLVSK